MCRLRGGMEARGSDPRVQGRQLPVLLSLGLVRVGALPWVQHLPPPSASPLSASMCDPSPGIHGHSWRLMDAPQSFKGRSETQVLTPTTPSCRAARQKKTMKLSRALSDLVKYTKSVGTHDVETEGEGSLQVGLWEGRGPLGWGHRGRARPWGPSGRELGQWGGAVEGVGSLRDRVIEGRAWGGAGPWRWAVPRRGRVIGGRAQ